jgi:hypothetical protein
VVPPLVSGAWASPHLLGWGVLQTPPRGGALALGRACGGANPWRQDVHQASTGPCPAHTLPVSGGPQGNTPGIPQKPALWAVSSTGLFGPVESQGCPLTLHRMESLPGVGLDHDKAGRHPVMLDVEGAQRCR